MRPPSFTLPLVVVAALAILLPIAGCGGGGGDGETSSVGGAKARFIERADTVCRRTSAIVHAGIQPYIEEGLEAVETPAVAGGMVDEIVAPDLEAQIVAIRAFLSAIEEAAQNGRKDPAELILHSRRALASARRLGEAYGFSHCGRLWIVLPSANNEARSEDDTKAAFVEHADSLCRRATAIVQAGLQPYVEKGPRAIKKPATVQGMAYDVVTLELEALAGAIKALDPPPGGAEEVKAFLSAIEEAAQNGRKDPAELIFHSRRALASARPLGEAYGFSYCGRLWIVLPRANSMRHGYGASFTSPQTLKP
jgi:hypothetical protein